MQALDRILAILDASSRNASAVSPARVAEETGMSLSTVVRLMQSLAESDVLVRSAETGQYRIGPRLVGIVARATHSFDYRIAAQPVLEKLRDATQESASLHMLQETSRVCVAAAYSNRPIGRIVPIGLPFPLIGSAAGHALLSMLPAPALDKLLRKICEPDRMPLVKDTLVQVRERGYAVSVNDSVSGVRGIATPVGADPALGCLSVSGPSWRFDGEAGEAALPHLREAAAALAAMRSMTN